MIRDHRLLAAGPSLRNPPGNPILRSMLEAKIAFFSPVFFALAQTKGIFLENIKRIGWKDAGLSGVQVSHFQQTLPVHEDR